MKVVLVIWPHCWLVYNLLVASPLVSFSPWDFFVEMVPYFQISTNTFVIITLRNNGQYSKIPTELPSKLQHRGLLFTLDVLLT